MAAGDPLPDRFAVQSVGGPLVARLSFSLDRAVALVSHLTDGAPVPDGVEEALRSAHADVLVVDHGLFAAAWRSADDTAGLLAGQDRLIKAVLATYAPGRIVLLRSVVRRFYWANGSVLPRAYPDDPRDVDGLREFVAVLDARFQAATGCLVVAEAAAQLPVRDALADDPGLHGDAILAVEDAVLAAARTGWSAGAIDELDSDFAAAVQRELAAGPLAPERVFELLPEHGLDTHEDVAALAAAFTADRDADWSAVAARAVPARGVVFEAMQRRFAANLRALRAHPYVYLPGGLDVESPAGLVSRLCRSWFLVVDPARPRTIQLRNYGRRGTFDAPGFCDAGYVCRPDQIESALESWEAYFERGRRGYTVPFRIAFASRAAFRESLAFLDYADILASENYCLTIDGNLPAGIDWQPKVDTSFLFDPRTRICMLRNGLGDQLFHYVPLRMLTERHGLRLFLDDLHFDDPKPRLQNAHTRPDLNPLARADGVFSQLFSRRLRHRRRLRPQPGDYGSLGLILDHGEYAALGLAEQVIVIDRLKIDVLLQRKINPAALPVVALTAEHLERAVAAPPPGVIFVDVLARGELTQRPRIGDKASWERALSWPGFASDAAVAVADRMRKTDAVVVHIRRGDRAAAGAAYGEPYFRAFLERAAAIGEYAHAHLFVFSDDFDYCRAHRDELGIELFGDAVTYVEGNRHWATVDDLHLMSLGKVMVCGISGFSRAAALVSSRVEYIFGRGYGVDGDDVWRRQPDLRV